MPSRVAEKLKKLSRGSIGKTRRTLLGRAARGTLLAASLAAGQLDEVASAEKSRIVSPRMLDRLSAPLTRYHE